MTLSQIPAFVVDTMVFSAALGSDPQGLVAKYDRPLSGSRVVISFQTIAEVRYGGIRAGWSQPRLRAMEQSIATALVVPPHDELATEWARLRNDCRSVGHALQDKLHFGDLWIAATARLRGLPLVTHDKIFDNTPGLIVVREG